MNTVSVISFLEDQKEIQAKLYDLSLEKRGVIISNDTERLTEIVQEEMRLLARLPALEKTRSRLLEEWAEIISCAPEEVTLTKILERAERGDSERLSVLQRELRSVMMSLRDLNDDNKKLLESKLEYTDTMLSLYVGAEDPLNNIYGSAGKTDDEIRKSAGMFNWEA